MYYSFLNISIMIKKSNLFFITTLLAFGLFWTSCSSTRTTGPSYVGKWKYEVPDMPSDNTGILVISKVGDGYSCVAITDSGYEQSMDKFDIQDGQLKAAFTDGGGSQVELDGTFEGDNLSGTISAQGMSIGYSATKIE
jgi:hypothetical protein